MGVTTVKCIVKETLPLIWSFLKEEYVKFPENQNEWMKIVNGFDFIGGLPHTLGAIDGE